MTAAFRALVVRQGFHAFNATWGVLAYHWLVSRELAAATIGIVTAVFGVFDYLRLRVPSLNRQVLEHPVWRRVIRPHEHHRMSGGFFFGLGVAVSLALFPKEPVEAACLAMGFGDAASTVVGVRYGSVPLVRGRSLQGTLAFVAATALVVGGFRWLAWGDDAVRAATWAGATAVVGALVELLSGPVDDNLTVPVVTSAVLTALAI
jgi:dolichol kinase